MLDYSNSRFRIEPFPIGYVTDIFPEDIYTQLSNNYPEMDKLNKRESLGNKYILTEFDGQAYKSIIEQNDVWKNFYSYIKSELFISSILNELVAQNIDLGLSNFPIHHSSILDSTLHTKFNSLKRRIKIALSRPENANFHLTSRFEFGSFPGNGGFQYPHTDAPRKVVSIVLSMVKRGEWDTKWGGGTAVAWPKDGKKSFNYLNKYLEFSEVDVLEQYEFLPNSAVIFIKTFNSWHSVPPITAPDDAIRKTLVVNIDLIGMPEFN